ncbi:MAG: hypothetical protein ABSB76_41305 [Streptosporangiaceae bacterium]
MSDARPLGDDPPGYLPVQAGMPELAFLLFHSAVGHHERHPPRRAGIAQRPGHRAVGDNLPDQPAAQLGEKPGLAAVAQPEPLADDRGQPLPRFEAIPVGRHEPLRIRRAAAPR